VSAHFDRDYYLSTNSDIRKAGVDPLLHFMQAGWKEGRNPSPGFNVRFYLRENPDVAAAGINPLVHYVTVGAREGRRPRRPLDALRRRLDKVEAPEDRAPKPLDPVDHSVAPGDLGAALRAAVNRRGLVLSFSHDDYAVVVGGVENVIGHEQRAFTGEGWGYLHVSPNMQLATLARLAPPEHVHVRLRLNGEHLGVCSFADLMSAVVATRFDLADLQCIIHHFKGHCPELIHDLVEATGACRPIVWTHDLFTLCPSYALMRNDVAFCGGPPPHSSSCAICCYGPERGRHVQRMRTFFERAKPTVLAPSDPILAFWRMQGHLDCPEAAVVPLAHLATVPREISPSDPLRVAHLGTRSITKGWSVFEDLALRLAGDDRYRFFHLGTLSGPTWPSVIHNIPVHVGPSDRSAMTDAVAEARIDVVVNWSLAFETFSFTTLEALAGGAYVVARAGAGNVWPAIVANAPGQGCALRHEEALLALFTGDDLRERVLTSRRRSGIIRYGGGTATWLMPHFSLGR
jgi:hypothetical protein